MKKLHSWPGDKKYAIERPLLKKVSKFNNTLTSHNSTLYAHMALRKIRSPPHQRIFHFQVRFGWVQFPKEALMCEVQPPNQSQTLFASIQFLWRLRNRKACGRLTIPKWLVATCCWLVCDIRNLLTGSKDERICGRLSFQSTVLSNFVTLIHTFHQSVSSVLFESSERKKAELVAKVS